MKSPASSALFARTLSTPLVVPFSIIARLVSDNGVVINVEHVARDCGAKSATKSVTSPEIVVAPDVTSAMSHLKGQSEMGSG